jgi:membrane protease YdiL (CAAX protease family)
MQRSFLFLEYSLVSLTGVCLILFGFIDGNYKIHVLATTFMVAVIPVSARLATSNWKIGDIGFQWKDTKASLIWYGLAAVLGSLGLCLYSYVFAIPNISVDNETLIYYSVGGSVIQELLYRGYLMRLGRQIFGDGILNIVVNVIIFVGMHIFYPEFLQKLWILIPAGIVFTLLYKKHSNIYLVSLVIKRGCC